MKVVQGLWRNSEMSESRQIVFTFKEIARELVRREGIQEGHWGIFVKFGIQGTNLGPNESGLFPTAIVPVLELGIQKFETPNNLTIDAAEVNPTKKLIDVKPEGPALRRVLRGKVVRKKRT
jgi:hypothetical protein